MTPGVFLLPAPSGGPASSTLPVTFRSVAIGPSITTTPALPCPATFRSVADVRSDSCGGPRRPPATPRCRCDCCRCVPSNNHLCCSSPLRRGRQLGGERRNDAVVLSARLLLCGSAASSHPLLPGGCFRGG